MAKGDVKITYSASDKIDKMYDRIEEIHTTQSVHISETRGEIKNVSDRVENLNEKFESAIVQVTTLIKSNTERLDMHEKVTNDRISRHDNDINDAKATMRTLRHVIGWVGAVISVLAGAVGWSIDNFVKNKVEEFNSKEIDAKIESKVDDKFNKILKDYNIQIQYEK